MTVSISDMTVPPQKPEMIQKAQDTVRLNYKELQTWSYHRRRKNNKEVVETWKKTDDELTLCTADPVWISTTTSL